MTRPVLRVGSKGQHVSYLQGELKRLGFFEYWIGGTFGPLTDSSVRYFQSTHIDRDGNFLKVDGEVGPKTWWALDNPSGRGQKSDLLVQGRNRQVSAIPSGINGYRKELLEWAWLEHDRNVREVPDGSNSGPGIDEYLANIGLRRAPWCYAFWGYGMQEATGHYPFDSFHGHVRTGWNEATRARKAFLKEYYRPIPGDALVMLYRDSRGRQTGSGHLSIVARVSSSGGLVNTFGGNEGNRVKFGIRGLSDDSIVGFINLFGDENLPPIHEYGIIESQLLSNVNTR